MKQIITAPKNIVSISAEAIVSYCDRIAQCNLETTLTARMVGAGVATSRAEMGNASPESFVSGLLRGALQVAYGTAAIDRYCDGNKDAGEKPLKPAAALAMRATVTALVAAPTGRKDGNPYWNKGAAVAAVIAGMQALAARVTADAGKKGAPTLQIAKIDTTHEEEDDPDVFDTDQAPAGASPYCPDDKYERVAAMEHDAAMAQARAEKEALALAKNEADNQSAITALRAIMDCKNIEDAKAIASVVLRAIAA